jgi:formate dehydrogenase major subunit
MLHLPLFSRRDPMHRPPQPFSQMTLQKGSRLQGATVTKSVCPYCAVGCGMDVYTKAGKLIDIEGNPDSPINEGTLCPKGANSFQLAVNPHRQHFVLHRAPHTNEWKRVPLDWALNRVAELVKEARDEGFVHKNEDGRLVNHLTNIGTLGGATLDNEENYLIKKLFSTGLGVVSVENQARI